MSRKTQYNGRYRAAIILAGGEGLRLRDLTRRIMGYDVPKQFCPILGTTTLIEQTRARVLLAVSAERTLTIVNRSHEAFYGPLLAGLTRATVVVQPEPRGTTAAILYGLLRLAKIAPVASVAIFPSDHYVGDDIAFMRHVELAFEAVEARPELTVLLGIVPDRAQPGYGWIEAAAPIQVGRAPIFQVRRFWEKPSLELANYLMKQGCLWNSFVVSARLSTLLGLVMITQPELYAAFAAIRPALCTPCEEMTVRTLYATIGCVDFSSQVLARFPVNLAVLPVSGVGWSDLGEPERVVDTLVRLGVRPQWAAA